MSSVEVIWRGDYTITRLDRIIEAFNDYDNFIKANTLIGIIECGKIKPYAVDEQREEVTMIKRREWEEFSGCGLLWFVNSILHVFGWSIVMDIHNGIVSDVYPARVSFRGFSEDVNTNGYIHLSEFIAENAHELLREAQE